MSASKLSGLIYIIIGLIIIFVIYQYFQKNGNVEYPFLSEVSNDLNGVNTIQIETAVTALFITESNDGQLHATLEQPNEDSKNALTLLSNVKNSTLTLEVVGQTKSALFGSLKNLNSKLHIKIPKHFKGKLDIETATGGTQINNVDVESLSIESTTGGLKLNNINSTEIKIESTTGSIHVNNVIADNLKAESTTGSIHLDSTIKAFNVSSQTGSIHLKQDDIYEDSKLNTTTGSIHVNLVEQPQSLYVKFESTTGSTHINKQGYNSIQNSKNEKQVQFGSGKTKLTAETTTGSLHLN